MKIFGLELPYDRERPGLSGFVCGIAVGAVWLLCAVSALAAPRTVEHCSWDAPGHNRFTGNVPQAVHDFKDVPPEVRARLQRRMERREYDELAVIKRDTIVGEKSESRFVDMRMMHFGRDGVCRTVSRVKWKPEHRERGPVYCEGWHCVIVPTVCSNVALVTRVPEATLPPVLVTATPEDEVLPADSIAMLGAPPMSDEPTFNRGRSWDDWWPWVSDPIRGIGVSRPGPGRAPPAPGDSGSPLVPVDPVSPPVPEPSPLAMLIAGVLVVTAWRFRQALAVFGLLALVVAAGALSFKESK